MEDNHDVQRINTFMKIISRIETLFYCESTRPSRNTSQFPGWANGFLKEESPTLSSLIHLTVEAAGTVLNFQTVAVVTGGGSIWQRKQRKSTNVLQREITFELPQPRSVAKNLAQFAFQLFVLFRLLLLIPFLFLLFLSQQHPNRWWCK